MNTPKVTIGMPVFNDIDYIEKSIKSILNQSFTNYEFIISDDQSTDGSAEICKKYEGLDSRIKYVRQTKNLGISKNMEYLINQSECEFFIWAADDDLWAPEFLGTLMQTLEENTDHICAFTTFTHINENDEIIDRPLNFDYEGNSAKQRIKKLILDANDAFGYGLFRREAIKNVKFPVWVWPNKKVSWNNIYPTLFFYLSKGNYKHIYGTPLFFNRVKERTNHSLTRKNQSFHLFALLVRKVNLFNTSLLNIFKAGKGKTAIILSPLLLKKWVIVPFYYELKNTVVPKRKSK